MPGDFYMLIIHDFGLDIKMYASKGKDNEFPMIHQCPNCSARRLLHRHGFYERNGLTEDEKELVVVICRLKCPSCKKTFSVIPDFLIPYYQNTLISVIYGIEQSLTLQQGKKKASRQLLSFYKKRFMTYLTWIHSFFADLGEVFSVAGNQKDKAVSYLRKIRKFGESLFLRKSFNHLSAYFMSTIIR
jgi:hypothetical protein